MRHTVAFVFASILVVATTAQAAPRRSSEPAAGARDKIICKRFVRIGSLVDGYRVCKTKAEWESDRERARQYSVTDSCRNRGDPSAGDPCMQ